jgi:hypothetical protein
LVKVLSNTRALGPLVLAVAVLCGDFSSAVLKAVVTLELFASAAAIQPRAAALEAGLMEQEQHYPCSAALP